MNLRRVFMSLTMLLSLVSSSVLLAQTAGYKVIDLKIQDVPIYENTYVDIQAKVFESTQAGCYPTQGNTIFAIPGMLQTAKTWEPLAAELFKAYPKKVWNGAYLEGNVCRFVAFDLPGHGGSSLPEGGFFAFGSLSMTEYVTAILGAMDRLDAINIQANVLMGFDLGGLIVPMMQQRVLETPVRTVPSYLAKYSIPTLLTKYSIRQVILLSPLPPKEVPWHVEGSDLAKVLLSFIVPPQPGLGSYLALPDPLWIQLFFSTLAGTVAPKAPDLATAATYNTPEPLGVVNQLADRPSLPRGLFQSAYGIELNVVGFALNPLIFKSELEKTYDHLTFDPSYSGLTMVSGPNAVHAMHMADPKALLEGIKDKINFPLILLDR